jgi:hypothetical protein
MKIVVLVSILFLSLFQAQLEAQDLQNERIRSISSRKRSIYLDRGIFHNGSTTNSNDAQRSAV